MRKIVSIIENLPVWYGLGIVLLYGLLLAEFFSTFMNLFPYGEVLNNVFTVILGIGYVVNVLSGFILWLIYALLFHLAALLFGGKSTFKRFLFVSAYPYLLAACMIFVGIFLLGDVSPLNLGNPEEMLLRDLSFQLAVKFINYSSIICYLVTVIIVRYIYQISYIYAVLSVAVPVTVIWLITESVKVL